MKMVEPHLDRRTQRESQRINSGALLATPPSNMMFHSFKLSRLFVLSILLVDSSKIHAKLDASTLVRVYDGVIGSQEAEWLHQECLKWDKGIGGNSVIQFPLDEPESQVPIAQFLDRLLHQLYPKTTSKYYVEFWKRPKWHHIQAHADMDENWEKQTQDSPSTPLRHPETGHVLYLKVGRYVQGPTVVWNVTRGGELVEKDKTFEMITVPAVPGRLLQFQGDKLHGVPRPANVYWTHREDDEDSFEEDSDQRSVLLFNLWPIEQGMLVGHELLNSTTSPVPIPDEATCKPATKWVSVEVVPYQEPSMVSLFDYLYRIVTSTYYEIFLIPLMGNVRRRGTTKRFVEAEGHYGIRDTFMQTKQVTKVTIQPPKNRILGFEL